MVLLVFLLWMRDDKRKERTEEIIAEACTNFSSLQTSFKRV